MGNQQSSYKEESMIVTKHALNVSAAALRTAGAATGNVCMIAGAAASTAAGAAVEEVSRVLTVNRRPSNH
jgi:hypothetical protein